MSRLAFAVALATATLLCPASAGVRQRVARHRGAVAVKPDTPTINPWVLTHGIYGHEKCPCIGMDNVKGEVAMATGATKTMFPAESGASCAAWDSGTAPECVGGSDLNYTKDGPTPDWCYQPWCYVDPCKCDVFTPAVSSYLPDATYQGKPVYYTYDTCGGSDTWTAANHKAACVNQKTEADCKALPKCGWNGKRCAGKEALGVCDKPLDATKHGADNCRCIGIDGLDGTVEATVNNKKFPFPAHYGSTCKAWEQELLPECKAEGEKPAWCDKAWCFVDPCSCKQAEPPKVTAGWLGPDVNFQGKNIYYSYTACGSEDLFTEKFNPTACVNQKSATDCGRVGDGKKCVWTTTGCLGIEYAQTCPATQPPMYRMPPKSGSWTPAPLAVLFLLSLAIRT